MVNVNIAISNELHKQMKVKCAIDNFTIKEYITKVLSKEIK